MTFTKGQLVIFIHKDKLAAGCIEHVYPADNKAVMIQTSGLRQRHIVIPVSDVFPKDQMKQAEKELWRQYEEKVFCYRHEIQTVSDLIEFPCRHDLFQDDLARKIYIEQAAVFGYHPKFIREE